MEVIHKLISTCLGIGYTPKGGGTIAAVACCIAWYFTWTGGNESFFWMEPLLIGVILVLGVLSSREMEKVWGEDNYRIVIDEVAGMALTLLFIPVRWQYFISPENLKPAFVGFRAGARGWRGGDREELAAPVDR